MSQQPYDSDTVTPALLDDGLDWHLLPVAEYHYALKELLMRSNAIHRVVIPEALIERAHHASAPPHLLLHWLDGLDDPTTATPEAFMTYRIRWLNYVARTAMGFACQVFVTPGIAALSQAEQSAIRETVECYDDFTADNDPYEEQDFGAFYHGEHHVFWRLDYYDRRLKYGSDDPANPFRTTRVLTIMLAHEY